MARLQQPRELAELKGMDVKNPQRYRTTIPKTTMPLGEYPTEKILDPALIWHELSSMCPAGVVVGSDRVMLEIACDLLAEYRLCPKDFSSPRLQSLRGILASFGMSPSDRNKLGVDKPDPTANPFAALDD